MSKSKQIIVRVQSPEHGTKRIESKPSETIADFLNKIQQEFGLGDTGWNVYKSRDKKDWIRTSRAKTLDTYKIKHGDMLFLLSSDRKQSNASLDSTSMNSASGTSNITGDMGSVSISGSSMSSGSSQSVVEDEVDQILYKEDGKIYRSRNEQLCRHGPQGKCLHCVPLEPYDEEFLNSCDPPIKFLSFHSYIRKLTGGADKGKFVSLENLSCKIKPGCTEHPPWPGGICTKCQPNAVTLNRQRYRHVDYVMFENASIVDRFLNYWRRTGNQRLGIMYGRYEPHKDTPLGIKATVAAIYEPPQKSSKNVLELLEDPLEGQVNRLAEAVGIRPVGWIFTDLLADDLNKGTVKHFRGNINSHFLSAQECIMALLRDITTASYGCMVSDDGYFLKLKNFEMAVRPSDIPDGGIVSGIIDMDFSGVPIRWAAPESLLGGHYSIFSDVWSVNILADEILNYSAWPYSDISDADINDMVTHIVFTHLKPQGFNRPRRVQGLILEGLATVPEQRLKLEALRERLLEILDNIDGGDSYSLYDTYSGVEGSRTKTYDIPPLTERQKQANSVYERGIPASIQRYRELEDPISAFSLEVAEHNSRLKEQTGLELIEISSDDNYKIESEDKMNKIKVMERVTDDFLKFTYNKLNEIDSSKMCVEPWPPSKSGSADGYKLHYSFPRSTRLLDVVLHKDRGETIGPYIELLYELANHVDSFHSAGWIFRCLRAKNVWILESQKREQSIVVPKFGKYRMIISSDFDAHLEQIKVDSREEMEGVQWLPIEAIKAGLYSKESDVYAFGMVTWEVMTAFGQEGVVYDQDEERELSCIPFNYQQSENILQHLIEGYIPEKPIKCPDWFYQEVTRPCLLHQKIDRPSMKTVLQILQSRLGKTLHRQILSLPPSVPPELHDVYEDADILYEDDYEGWGDVYTSPNSSDDEESIKPVEDDKAKSSVVKWKPPPPPQINMDKKDFHADGRRRPPPPVPPLPQKPSKIASDMADCSLPPVPRRDRDTSNPQESKDDKGYKTCPSVLKRPPVVLREKEEDSANPSDVNSCKSLPLPMTPPQSNENKAEDQDVYASQINPISPKQQTKDALNSAKKLPLPPKPPKPSKPNSTDAYPKIDLGKDESSNTTALPVSPRNIPQKHDEKSPEQLSVSPNENQSTLCGSKTRTEQSNSSDSVYKGSDFYGNVPSMMFDDMRETFKGSDFNSSNNVSIGLGDTQKGSDFNSSDNLGDTHKGSDIDRTVRATKSKSIGDEPTSAIKTKPKVFPKPKAKPKSPFYVNDQELKADDVSTPVYVNQNQPGTKPAVPPRKPLNK